MNRPTSSSSFALTRWWLFPLLALPLAAQQPEPQRVPVHGVVVNAVTGEPLPRALVRLEGDTALSALTDGEGRFEIPDVESGLQTFDVEKPGYSTKTEFSTFSLPAAKPVRVAPGLGDLRFAIAPRNVLTGRITLASGDPGVGVGIVLLRQTTHDGHADWGQQAMHQSTPDGSFRFADLPDGVYALHTAPTSDNERFSKPDCTPSGPHTLQGYPIVYYGGSADVAGAARIQLADGQTANAEINLAPVAFHVAQVTPEHVPTGPDWNYSIVLSDAAGSPVNYPVLRDETTHALCALVPDGSYFVQFSDFREGDYTGSVPPSRQKSPPQSLTALVPVAVEGAPVSLRTSLEASTGPVVHIRYEPEPPHPPTPNTTSPEDEGPEASSGPAIFRIVSASGVYNEKIALWTDPSTLRIEPAPPGAYWFQAAPDQPGVCIGAVTAGNQALGHTPLAVGASAIDIELVLRTDCAKLTLQLADSPTNIGPGEEPFAFVSVVPEFDYTGTIVETPLEAAAVGQITTFPYLTPGVYRIVVSRAPHPLEWRNPAVVAALSGQEITLEPNGHVTVTVEAPRP